VLWPEMPPSSVAVAPKSAPASPPEAVAPSTAAASPAPAADTSAVAPVALDPVAAVPAVSAAAPATHPAAVVVANYQPGSGEGTVLRLAFDQQSWVQVRDASGRVVLESLFPSGSSREVTARPPLTLIVGNAPGVRLTYAGRAIDLAPHTRVAVARLTLE
jgi:cytoskeleton protein RodZ